MVEILAVALVLTPILGLGGLSYEKNKDKLPLLTKIGESVKLFFKHYFKFVLLFMLVIGSLSLVLNILHPKTHPALRDFWILTSLIALPILPFLLKYDLKNDCDEFNYQKYEKYINIFIVIYYLILVFLAIIYITLYFSNISLNIFITYGIFVACIIILSLMFILNRFYICTTKMDILIRICKDFLILVVFYAACLPPLALLKYLF